MIKFFTEDSFFFNAFNHFRRLLSDGIFVFVYRYPQNDTEVLYLSKRNTVEDK